MRKSLIRKSIESSSGGSPTAKGKELVKDSKELSKSANISTSTSKTNQNLKHILEGCICLVETVNEDGLDASAENRKVLESLGAKTELFFNSTCTHFISNDINSQNGQAAKIFNLHCVSPLWIEQCQQSKSKAPEKDFSILRSIPPVKSDKTNHVVIKEPVLEDVRNRRNVESPHFSSSQREVISQKIEKPIKKRKPKANIATVQTISASDDEREIDGAKEDSSTDVIHVPSFKPYVAPELSLFKKRRSERICDSRDNEADEILAKLNSGIDPNAVIPVIYDDEEWPPTTSVLDMKRKSKSTLVSSSSSSSSSSSPSASVVLKETSSNKKSNKEITAGVEDVIIAVTSFDNSEGERETLIHLIEALKKLIPTEKGRKVSFLRTSEDVTCTKCSRIVAPEASQRTIRILFGLARNIPIVSREWLYACREKEQWLAPREYLLSMNGCQKTGLVSKRKQIFTDEVFFFGVIVDPNPEVLEELVSLVGAKVTTELANATAIINGMFFKSFLFDIKILLILIDKNFADVWFKSLADDKMSLNLQEIALKICRQSKSFSPQVCI